MIRLAWWGRLILVTVLASCFPQVAAKSNEIKKWMDGPIRYIARPDEMKHFRSLETNEARAIFISRFWRRRDPSPETLTNEYREMFWQRVQQANDSFIDSSRQGWMTDRGKIWILYGPPAEIDEYGDLQADDGSGHGVIRWIYEGRPGERMDLDPIVVVPFERRTDGEYHISYNPKLASVFFNETAIDEGQNDIYDRFFEMAGSPTQSQLSVMLDLGRMQEVPPAEQVLIESVETMEAYEMNELPVTVNQFFRPEDGRAIAVINIDLSDIEKTDNLAILARFQSGEPGAEPRLLGEDSFKLATSGDYRLAQARLSLPPGNYAVTVVVADPVNVDTSLHRTDIKISDTPQTLRISDAVWAIEMAEVEYGALASYDEPFHLGPFRVLPKLDSVFQRGDTIRLFVEVYGAEYPLNATYQLEGLEADDKWVPLGQATTLEQSAAGLAWEVETSARWPLGEYRVRVEVMDAAERRIGTEALFSIEEPPSIETTAAAAPDAE